MTEFASADNGHSREGTKLIVASYSSPQIIGKPDIIQNVRCVDTHIDKEQCRTAEGIEEVNVSISKQTWEFRK